MIYFRRILFLLCMIPVLMLAVLWVMLQIVLIPINSVLSYIIKGEFTEESVFSFIIEYPLNWVNKINPDHE
jgi:hypothetical protein